MEEKNFDEWNEFKKALNDTKILHVVHDGEIWFCSIGINVGHEQDGKHGYFERPVLIIRKWNATSFLAIPLSSTLHEGSYYHPITLFGRKGCALLTQIKIFDGRRLQRRVGRISSNELKEVCQQISDLILRKNTNPPKAADSQVVHQQNAETKVSKL